MKVAAWEVKRRRAKIESSQKYKETVQSAQQPLGDGEEKNSLILQDGLDHSLCDDKAVWVHHAVLSANLSCTPESREP